MPLIPTEHPLTGSAGLQLKGPGGAPKKFGGLALGKPKKPTATASAFAGAMDDDLDDDASERQRMSQQLQEHVCQA